MKKIIFLLLFFASAITFAQDVAPTFNWTNKDSYKINGESNLTLTPGETYTVNYTYSLGMTAGVPNTRYFVAMVLQSTPSVVTDPNAAITWTEVPKGTDGTGQAYPAVGTLSGGVYTESLSYKIPSTAPLSSATAGVTYRMLFYLAYYKGGNTSAGTTVYGSGANDSQIATIKSFTELNPSQDVAPTFNWSNKDSYKINGENYVTVTPGETYTANYNYSLGITAGVPNTRYFVAMVLQSTPSVITDPNAAVTWTDVPKGTDGSGQVYPVAGPITRGIYNESATYKIPSTAPLSSATTAVTYRILLYLAYYKGGNTSAATTVYGAGANDSQIAKIKSFTELNPAQDVAPTFNWTNKDSFKLNGESNITVTPGSTYTVKYTYSLGITAGVPNTRYFVAMVLQSTPSVITDPNAAVTWTDVPKGADGSGQVYPVAGPVARGIYTESATYKIPTTAPLSSSTAGVTYRMLLYLAYYKGGNTSAATTVYGAGANDSQIAKIKTANEITALGTKKFLKKAIAFYPNPARDLVTFSDEIATKTYKVINLSGAIVKEVPATGTLNVSDLAKGIYIIATDSGTAKLIKE